MFARVCWLGRVSCRRVVSEEELRQLQRWQGEEFVFARLCRLGRVSFRRGVSEEELRRGEIDTF